MDKKVSFKNVLKNKKLIECIICFTFFLITFSITSSYEGNNFGDRMWNFQWAYKLYNGFKIYKEVELIATPLYFILEKIVFIVFSPNYISVHLLNAIINTFMYYMAYLIFKEYIKSTKKSVIYTFLLILFTLPILFDGGAYTSLAIAFYLLGIFLKTKNKNNWFTDGVILFMIFFSKQNVALFYIFSLICEMIFLRRDKIKEAIQYLIKSILTFTGLLLCFALVLFLNNCLYDFINYCFLGMKEFTKNFTIGFDCIVYIVIFILGNGSLWIYKKNNKNISKTYLLYIYSIFMILISYPILDSLHLSLGFVAFIVLSIVLADKIIINKEFRQFIKMLLYVCSIIIIIYSIVLNVFYVYNFR